MISTDDASNGLGWVWDEDWGDRAPMSPTQGEEVEGGLADRMGGGVVYVVEDADQPLPSGELVCRKNNKQKGVMGSGTGLFQLSLGKAR